MQIGNVKFTLYKVIALVLLILSFIMVFCAWMSVDYYMSLSLSLKDITSGTIGSMLEGWGTVLKILTIVFYISLVAALAGIVLDKKLLVLPCAIDALLLLLFVIIAVIKANSEAGMSVVKIGAGAIFCFLFAAGSFAALVLEERNGGALPAGIKMPELNLGAIGGWTCPSCGASQGGGQKFCDRCGTKKPEPPRCPNCGKLVKPDATFCSECGTKL